MIRRGGPATIAILTLLPQLVPSVVRAADPTKQQCVSANERAQDLRRAAQLREARKELAVCVSASCPAPVREDCAARLSEVDAAMPSLVFVAKDHAGNDLSAVLVTMDGLPFADTLDGTAVAVDPGEHKFIFEGEGLPATEKVLVVHEGDKSRHVNVVLGASVVDSPGDSEDGPLAPKNRRTIGFALGGAGALGVAIGGVFGIVAKTTYDHAWNECGKDARGCTPQGVSDGRAAHDQATVSTVAFVTGALLLAGGAALYFSAPKMPAVAVGPRVSPGGAGLSVETVW
jgi:hypothetical protein